MASIFPHRTKFAPLIAHLDDPRPILLTAIFTDLRASELRGLPWVDVDLTRGEQHVRQRADRYNAIGRPKSEAAERMAPLPPMLVQVLREHKFKVPEGRTRPRVSEW